MCGSQQLLSNIVTASQVFEQGFQHQFHAVPNALASIRARKYVILPCLCILQNKPHPNAADDLEIADDDLNLFQSLLQIKQRNCAGFEDTLDRQKKSQSGIV
jgi:hypothetical protein